MKLRYSVIALILLLCPSASFAITVPERPSNYVVDMAGIVDDRAEMSLNGYLKELEQKTSAQVIVLTLPTIEGGSIEDVSLGIAEKWALGQRGKDNGLLFLIAMAERKYRFEVGYGLEGILPDSKVGSIGRSYIVPAFRKGDYSSGISQAVLAVAGEIARDSGVQITGMPQRTVPSGRSYDRERGKPSLVSTLFSFLFFIVLIYLFIRHPRLLLLMFLFSGMGGRRSHWGGGGGFGGGGFGGGGGGGFGGGGASGGW